MQEELQEKLKKIDYNKLLANLISYYDYEDYIATKVDRPNLLEDKKYQEYDAIVQKNIDKCFEAGIVGEKYEQSKNANGFLHVALNRKFSDRYIRFRLYLSPEDKNLYKIINEIVKRCGRSGEPVYFKYSRADRLDKLLFYLEDVSDLKRKLNLLNDIKKDNPELFTNMDKSDCWLSESPFKGAYITPENITVDNNNYHTSYTQMFLIMMYNIQSELKFTFNEDDLKKVPQSLLLDRFKFFFQRELGKYGLLTYLDMNNEMKVYTNNLFPGFGKNVNEDIFLSKEGIDIGKDMGNGYKKYYNVPFGRKFPENEQELKSYDYEILTREEEILKICYPDVWKEKSTNKKIN